MDEGPVEAELRFVQNTRPGGSPVSKYENHLVILGKTFEKTKLVKPGETWKCILYRKLNCMVAEPIDRMDEPATLAPLLQVAPAVLQDPNPPPPRHSDQEEAEDEHSEVGEGTDDEALWAMIDSFTPADTILLFVHGTQADAAADAAGTGIDWRDLRLNIAGAGTLQGAIYHDRDEGDAERGEFHDDLARLHYTIRPKPRRASTAREREEAERVLDIDYALDVFQTTLLRAETVFLLVNDARFVPLVRALQHRARRVLIISSRNRIAPELARVADKPLVFLEDLFSDAPEVTEAWRRS